MFMETLTNAFMKDGRLEGKAHTFGFIGEADFDRRELHGFEVDLTGHVIIPALCPEPDITMPASVSYAVRQFASMSATETTAC
jgi:hypothetical protein